MTPAVTGVKRAPEPDAVRTMLSRQLIGKSGGAFPENQYVSDYVTVTTNNNIPTTGYTVVTPSYNTMSYPALDLMAKTEGAQ